MKNIRRLIWIIFYVVLGLMLVGWVVFDLRGLIQWSANLLLGFFVVLSLLMWWLDKRYTPSVEGLSKAIDRFPDNPMSYYGRAMVYIKEDDFASARIDLSRAIELDPDYTRAIVWRGITHDEMGDLEAAVSDLSRALEIEPENSTALYNRGHVYQKQGKYALALEDFHKALRISPGLDGLKEAIEILESLDIEGSSQSGGSA